MDVERKLTLIKEVGEEIITEEELRTLLETNSKPIAYDGFEPSGQIHIAQGLMRAITVNKLTSTGIHFRFWVADWFAMLNNKLGGDLEKIRVVGNYFIEIWKSCGMDLDHVEFIWTSEFIRKHPEYWETVLKLSSHATIQRVMRCGQIMGREESTSNPSAQILYPLMQAADIHHLHADIAQLGLDQRKVNMLARELFPKLGLRPPVAVHHHMLMGLGMPPVHKTGIERAIELKMSKSKPDSAIFMMDSRVEIDHKLMKAYCPVGVIEENPVLEYYKYIVFERFKDVVINRDKKFGGDLTFTTYDELAKAFKKKELHPLDVKKSLVTYVDTLLQPVREYFEKNKRAKKLYEEVKSFKVTR